MLSFKKSLLIILVLLFTINSAIDYSSYIPASADEVGEINFSLKLINKGTGVKITIGKTKGAEGYKIYMMETDTPYTDYRYDKNYSICVGKIEKTGAKKRSFIIKGLPEGVYTFLVSASYHNENGFEHDAYSEEKSINIKSSKTNSRPITELDFTDVKVGDIIKLGAYEQDDDMNNGKESIEWIVLSKSDSKMLVMSKYILDNISYNKEKEYTSWEECTLRKWLNECFYEDAFTDEEKSIIIKSKVKNPANPYSNRSEASKTTKDKVFLLSLQEVSNTKYGFNNDLRDQDNLRQCSPTKYALARGWNVKVVENTENEFLTDNTAGAWWLRTVGDTKYYVTDVNATGQVLSRGHLQWGADGELYTVWAFDLYAYAPNRGVRPALYIKLK